MKTKEFNAIVKGANVELNSTFKNPFVICNLLNKASKGDFSKVENCKGLTKENLAKVAKVVKGMHANRYAFDTCILPKCNRKLGTFIIVPEKQSEKASILCGEIVTYNGKVLCVDDKENVGIFRPIALTISGVFNAFAKVAKVKIKENEKSEKEAAKEAKRADKEFENAKKCIIKDYNSGKFGESELVAKLSDLRTKYGK